MRAKCFNCQKPIDVQNDIYWYSTMTDTFTCVNCKYGVDKL